MEGQKQATTEKFKKTAPQDLNAEKSLLGAILLSDTNFP